MSTKYIPAGAGSGKTHKLTHDLAKMLTREDSPVAASRIILTTFTRSAAADFTRRAREVLIKEYNDPARAAELDGALIGTVHSVCERFVKKYWYRLNLNLPLNIMSEGDKKLFVSRTTENVANDSDIKFFSSFAREFDMDSNFWKDCVKSIIDKKYSFDIKDLEESSRISCEDIDKVFSREVDPGTEDVIKTFFDRVKGVLSSESTKTAEGNLIKIRAILDRSLFYQAKEIRSIIKLGEKPTVYDTNKNWKKISERGYSYDDLSRVYNSAGNYLISREIGSCMKKCVKKLFDLAGLWESEYKNFKADNRLLDFNDLEQLFLQILDLEDVREDIRSSYDVMMVDEFQDSNPVQIRIFRKMMELVKETEFVGDSKQAIYGFRGTESTLVDDFIEGIEYQKPLKESYRSRKALVNAANAIFCKAFGIQQLPVDPKDDSKPYDGVSLEGAREEPDGMAPALQHWNFNNYSSVGKKIQDLISEKKCLVVRKKDKKGKEIPEHIEYRDIAILLRNGYNIGRVADDLREAGVPVSILEEDFISRAEVQLTLSIIRYIFNERDKGAKADILHLIRGMSSEDIIKNSITGKWSEDVELFFKKIDSIRSRVSILSIPEIVDSIVLELNFYGNVDSWGQTDSRRRNIGFISSLATEYENQCSTINVAPTLPGFISYVYDYESDKRLVDKTNTVKVLTYHNAKGLDWPMVILDELDSFGTDDQEVIKKGYKGVHNIRQGDQGGVSLHFFPGIMSKQVPGMPYNNSSNLPDVIVEGIKETKLFDYVKKRRIEEERRLLYVGFTRAKDYLVTLGNSKSKYSWLVYCGGAAWDVGKDVPSSVGNSFTLWHSDHPSTYIDLPLPEPTEISNGKQPQTWKVPKKVVFDDKYQSPSRHDRNKAEPVSVDSGSKPVTFTEAFQGKGMIHNIPNNDKNEKEDSDTDNIVTRCGTCIHHIFAAYNPDGDKSDMVQMADRIIKGMGLANEFPSPESAIDSAAQFFGWLKDVYGEGTAFHELPFVNKQNDGTIIRGEMDLVWDLPNGSCVLVDYKSFHGDKELNAIKAHACQQGYPSQLKTYKGMLESGSKERKVKDVLIYYFVLGKVVKLDV